MDEYIAGAGAARPARGHRAAAGRRMGLLLAGVAAWLLATAAQAFDPQASTRVSSIAVQADGRILIGGEFTNIDGVARNHYARLNPDGSLDAALHNSSGGLAVHAVAVQADGKALVGGKGASGAGGLLRLNTDGSVDAGFQDVFTGGNNSLHAIVPLADGRILVGGDFTEIAGEPRSGIARLNANGTLDTTFDTGSATIGIVRSIAVEADGHLVIGGSALLMRLGANGATTVDQPLPNVVSTQIRTVAVQADGKILVGADSWWPINFGDDVSRGFLARLNADGTVDDGFVPGYVQALWAPLALQPDGMIVFAQGYGQVSRIQPTGAADPAFGNVNTNQQNFGLALQADGKILVGGDFAQINGLNRGRIARFHSDGRLDNGAPGPLTVGSYAVNGTITPAATQQVEEGTRLTYEIAPDAGYALASVTGCGGTRNLTTYTTGFIWADCTVIASFVLESEVFFDPDPNSYVEDIAVQADGRIVVAGWFSQIGGIVRQGVARLNPATGAAEANYEQISGFAMAMVRQPDGKVLVSEQYGVMKRINEDGTLDTGFTPTQLSNDSVRAIGLQADGKILIGGGFSSVNGTTRNRIARLNADGTLDTTFDAGSGPDHWVYRIEPEPDGHIVITGAFTSVQGTSKHGAARLTATGTLDADSFPRTGTDTYDVYRYADGSYLIGGSTAINLGDGTPPNSRLIKLTPAGERDLAFVADVNGAVQAIAVQSDGAIVIAGEFTVVNGATRQRLARLTATGELDETFVANANGTAKTLALQADGKILVGGQFSQIAGYPRRHLARLKADGRVDVDGFLVTPFAGEHGTISPNAPQTVDPGLTTQFTIVPDPGYVIGAVTGCGGSLQGLVYTTGPITSHCAVNAEFLLEDVPYTVTPVSVGGGSLAPSMPQTVLYAQTATFDIAPDAGHYLAGIEGCDGTLDEAGSHYTTGRILADCTVTATFSAPADIAAIGGTPQITAVDTRFAQTLQVRLVDDAGDPAPAGIEVAFAAPGSGASATLSAATTLTDAQGVASVTARANGIGGAYTVVASAGALTASFSLANEAIDHGGLTLDVTLGRQPAPACGTERDIDAVAGEQINYCFTVTNTSDVTLRYHTLGLATHGYAYQYTIAQADRLFDRREHALAPGESYRYNHVFTVGTDDQAPSFTWTATASLPGYDVNPDAGVEFTDIRATGSTIPVSTAGPYQLSELPFPIMFYGQAFLDGGHSILCINQSGAMGFMPGDEGVNCPVPGPFYVPPLMGDNQLLWSAAHGSSYANAILPYWDMLGDNGSVHLATLGEAPNRRMIVQWQDKDRLTAPNPVRGATFQAVIEETTGRIHYVYDALTFDTVEFPNPDYGASASVGAIGYTNNSQQALFVQHSHNAAVLQEGQSITLTPTDVPRYVTAEVSIDVGQPRLTLAPPSVSAQAPVGGAATRTLGIGNGGDMALEWSLEEAAARTHFPADGVTYRTPPQAQLDAAQVGPGMEIVADDASYLDPRWFEPGLFETPAYGLLEMHNRRYPISFDAATPQVWVHASQLNSQGEVSGGDFVGDDFSRMYTFDRFTFGYYDVVTGAHTAVSEYEAAEPEHVNGYHLWSGMVWDRSTDTLFASTTTGAYCEDGPASDLYSVDVATGVPTRVAPIVRAGGAVCIVDIAVAADGALFGIDSEANTLVAIDKTTGEAATIGWLGFNLGNGLGFPHSADFDEVDGSLYLAAGHSQGQVGGWFRIDTVTGLASWVGPINPPVTTNWVGMSALGIATSGGACADPATVPWLSVNQPAGVLSPGAEAPVQVALDASGLAAGVHEATLCVFSNDRSQSLVRVPVSFTVGGEVPVAIFADDFEGTP